MFRELLRELPNVQPRRSFTLDPATVAPQRRLLFPTLRWSSLVAALLFVIVVGVDVLGSNSPGAPAAAPIMPMASPAASVAKASPANESLFNSSGGSAESMAQPQGSPPAAIGADQANPESASLPLTAASPAASAAPSPAASAAAIAEASSSPAANDAAAEASPAIAAAESPAASVAPSPAMARDAQADDPAGGTTAQLPQSGFRTNEPAAADTIELVPNARAQGSWWSSYGLRVAEVALGLIALVLGGAALWTWRRQL